MIDIRHLRLRRRESLPRRAWNLAGRLAIDVLAATVIARHFWRHRPPLLGR